MEMETERLILRDIINEDAKNLAELLNCIEITKHLANVPHPYTIEHAKTFVERCQENAKQSPRRFYEFVIVLKQTNKIIGVISLKELNKEEKQGEIVTG